MLHSTGITAAADFDPDLAEVGPPKKRSVACAGVNLSEAAQSGSQELE